MSTGITVETLVRQDRIILMASVTAVAAVSWIVLLVGHEAHTITHDGVLRPHVRPLGLQGLGPAFAMWMVMMVAMMLPPVMPWILLFASTNRRRCDERRPYFPTALFVSGYFAVWAGFCVAAAATQVGLQHGALLTAKGLIAGPYASGVLLLVAGIFQCSPLKLACLRHCRSPLGFFLSRWRNGPVGAFRMGARHGVYCLGCCWALMALSFVLGIMNLLWMATLTLFLCVEKIARGGVVVSRLFGAVLMVWGGWLVVF